MHSRCLYAGHRQAGCCAEPAQGSRLERRNLRSWPWPRTTPVREVRRPALTTSCTAAATPAVPKLPELTQQGAPAAASEGSRQTLQPPPKEAPALQDVEAEEAAVPLDELEEKAFAALQAKAAKNKPAPRGRGSRGRGRASPGTTGSPPSGARGRGRGKRG